MPTSVQHRLDRVARKTGQNPPCETCQFLIDEEGIINKGPAHNTHIYGHRANELIGRSLRDFLLELNADWEDILPPKLSQDHPPLYLPWTHEGMDFATGLFLHFLSGRGQTYVTLVPSLAPEEKLKRLSIKDIPCKSALIEQLFLRLQTAENRLLNYIHHFPGIFFSQKVDLSFNFIGPGFEELLGCPTNSLYHSASRFMEMINEKDRFDYSRDLQTRSNKREPFTSLLRIRHFLEGSIIYLLEVRTPLFSPSGLLLGYDEVWLDLTRQTIAENRLADTGWRESISTLTVGLVHDFGNLVSGIHSLSELYCDSLEKTHDLYKGMEMIRKSSLDSQQLVRRIIELNGETSNRKNFHNVEDLIQNQLDLISLIFPKKTSIVTQFAGGELPVYCDDVGFRQSMLNLAINSRDAMEMETQGQIFIKVSKAAAGAEIFKSVSGNSIRAPKSGTVIQFRDNGTGIREELMGKVFDPYFTTKDIQKGSGLGLYNTKLFVEKMGGKIGAASEPNKGLSIFIFLPLADFTQSPLEDISSAKTYFYYKDRPKIVVYSALDARYLSLVDKMQKRDWETITFDDPEKLTGFLQDAFLRPDLVLLIEMGYDGRVQELTRSITQIDPRIKIAVQAAGRNPDELDPSWWENADLLLNGESGKSELLNQLAALIESKKNCN